MDGATTTLKAKLNQLLKEAARIAVVLDRADGTITGVPHYSVIEARAHELGQQLSREIQARQMGELVAGRPATAPCPKCRARCDLNLTQRTVTSIDGPVEVQELEGYCLACRRAFFPRPRDAGVGCTRTHSPDGPADDLRGGRNAFFPAGRAGDENRG